MTPAALYPYWLDSLVKTLRLSTLISLLCLPFLYSLVVASKIYYNNSNAVGTKMSHRVAIIDGVAVILAVY